MHIVVVVLTFIFSILLIFFLFWIFRCWISPFCVLLILTPIWGLSVLFWFSIPNYFPSSKLFFLDSLLFSCTSTHNSTHFISNSQFTFDHQMHRLIIEFYLIFCCELFTVNLSNAGQDDSSSEEAQSNHHQISNGKPAVPPRPRSISATRGGIISNLVNNKQLKTTNGNAFGDDLPCKDNDVANADRKCLPLTCFFSKIFTKSNLNVYWLQWARSLYQT